MAEGTEGLEQGLRALNDAVIVVERLFAWIYGNGRLAKDFEAGYFSAGWKTVRKPARFGIATAGRMVASMTAVSGTRSFRNRM